MVLHAGRAFMLRGSQEPVPASNMIFISNDILFHNTTLYFAIISGIIYSRSYPWLRTSDFYYSRFKNVAVPYTVMTIFFTTILARFLVPDDSIVDIFLSYLKEILYNLFLGEAQYTYWYIPVVLILYVVSPLIRALMSSKVRVLFITLALFLPLLFSRTGTEISFSTIIYFLGAYVLGVFIGEAVDDRLHWIARQVPVLLLLAIFATGVLYYLYAADIDYWGPISLRESAYYVQKISVGMLFLVWLWRSSDSLPRFPVRVLDLFASAAFSLYFIHGFVFRRFVGIAADVSAFPGSNWYLISGSVVTFFLGTAACWLILLLLRTILGDRSKLLVGT